jgi:hypothetical protein
MAAARRAADPFELWCYQRTRVYHSALARNAGLSDHAVTTLANGGIPENLSEHDKIAARLAGQLSTRHRIDDEL